MKVNISQKSRVTILLLSWFEAMLSGILILMSGSNLAIFILLWLAALGFFVSTRGMSRRSLLIAMFCLFVVSIVA